MSHRDTILSALSEGEWRSTPEIAEDTGIKVQTVHRILSSELKWETVEMGPMGMEAPGAPPGQAMAEGERMTIIEDLIDDIEGMNKYEFMVLRYLARKGQAYKTAIMQDIIREFPDDMEHGEYLIPGKEFSDDLDQAMDSLRYCGQIQLINGRLAVSDYGRTLYETIMAHPEIEIDADLAEFIERLEASE